MRTNVARIHQRKVNGREVPVMGMKFDVKRAVGITSIVISVITWVINRSWKKEYEPVMLGTGTNGDGKEKNVRNNG